MLLSHAITLAEARSHLAALARRAYNDEASAEYERVLLHLDVIHGDYIPGISDVYDEGAEILYGIAERAIEKGILEVIFDRGGYRYHGRVKALADAAREGGLKF